MMKICNKLQLWPTERPNLKKLQDILILCISHFQVPTSPGVLHILSAQVLGFVPSEFPGGRTYYLLSKYQVVS